VLSLYNTFIRCDRLHFSQQREFSSCVVIVLNAFPRSMIRAPLSVYIYNCKQFRNSRPTSSYQPVNRNASVAQTSIRPRPDDSPETRPNVTMLAPRNSSLRICINLSSCIRWHLLMTSGVLDATLRSSVPPGCHRSGMYWSVLLTTAPVPLRWCSRPAITSSVERVTALKTSAWASATATAERAAVVVEKEEW